MKLRPKDALAAANAFRSALGGSVVSHDEISRRWEICSSCPQRKPLKGIAPVVSAILGGAANRHRVPPDLAGSMCGVCGCSLMLLVPATREDLHVDSPEEAAKRPEKCWINDVDKQGP